MVEELARFIESASGHGAEVSELERIPGGFSYETWRLRARFRDAGGVAQDLRLVMRKAPRGGVLEPYDPSKEFRLLKALEETTVPAPRAYWLEATGSILGTPFYLMEFVDGEIPLPWDEKIPADTRAEMHRQFADVLAALHTLDWRRLGAEFLGVPPDPEDPAALELDRCEAQLARIRFRSYPELSRVIEALRAKRPSCPRLTIVHDDYRMGNFVWRDGRIAAFLDWERAFLGDPMADVAFSRLENLAGWCSIAGAIAERYAAGSGIAVDETRVAYWSALEALKGTLVGLTGLNAFAEGRTSDLRLVEIGRGAHKGVGALAAALGVGS